MCGHVASANDRLSVANRRINRRSGENTGLEQLLTKKESLHLATDEQGHDRRLRGADVETRGAESCVHFVGILPKPFFQLGLLSQDLQRFQNATGDRGGQRGGKDETTCFVL